MSILEAGKQLCDVLEFLIQNDEADHPMTIKADKAIKQWALAVHTTKNPNEYEAEIRRLRNMLEHAASRLSFLADDLKNNLK